MLKSNATPSRNRLTVHPAELAAQDAAHAAKVPPVGAYVRAVWLDGVHAEGTVEDHFEDGSGWFLDIGANVFAADVDHWVDLD